MGLRIDPRPRAYIRSPPGRSRPARNTNGLIVVGQALEHASVFRVFGQVRPASLSSIAIRAAARQGIKVPPEDHHGRRFGD
jgi:hypothetical protein